MARRLADKARSKTVPARTPSRRDKSKAADGAVHQRLAAVERERDTLRAELEEAQERLRTLEESHAAVRDRIAWALDSLHNILVGKA